jgi:hypothetical protein
MSLWGFIFGDAAEGNTRDTGGSVARIEEWCLQIIRPMRSEQLGIRMRFFGK